MHWCGKLALVCVFVCVGEEAYYSISGTQNAPCWLRERMNVPVLSSEYRERRCERAFHNKSSNPTMCLIANSFIYSYFIPLHHQQCWWRGRVSDLCSVGSSLIKIVCQNLRRVAVEWREQICSLICVTDLNVRVYIAYADMTKGMWQRGGQATAMRTLIHLTYSFLIVLFKLITTAVGHIAVCQRVQIGAFFCC